MRLECLAVRLHDFHHKFIEASRWNSSASRLAGSKTNQRNDNCAAVSRRYIAVVGTWRRKSLLRLRQAAWRVRRSIRKRPDLIWLLRPDLALSFSACTNSFAKRNDLSALPDGPTSKLWLPLEGPRRFRRRVQRRDQRVHDEN